MKKPIPAINARITKKTMVLTNFIMLLKGAHSVVRISHIVNEKTVKHCLWVAYRNSILVLSLYYIGNTTYCYLLVFTNGSQRPSFRTRRVVLSAGPEGDP